MWEESFKYCLVPTLLQSVGLNPPVRLLGGLFNLVLNILIVGALISLPEKLVPMFNSPHHKSSFPLI